MLLVPLRVLLLEDTPDDAELVLHKLGEAGFDVSHERVATAHGFREALDRGPWDVIVSDYRMPEFTAPDALEILRERGIDMPFILVSGSIGEEYAVRAMKAGAHDFFLKSNLTRLPVAVEREVSDARARREASDRLRQAEEKYRLLVENVKDHAIFLLDPRGNVASWNAVAERVTGFPEAEIFGKPFDLFFPDDERAEGRAEQILRHALAVGFHQEQGFRLRRDGRRYWAECATSAIRDRGALVGYSQIIRDVSEKRRAARSLEFLVGASETLSASLDSTTTLQSVSRLAVPELADWCVIELQHGAAPLEVVAVTHVEEAKAGLLREMLRRYPLAPDAPHGAPRALRAGLSELIPQVTEALRGAIARDAGHLAMLRVLGPQSWITVPLIVQGRSLGAITFALAAAGRRYDAVDLTLAEEVARRAAVAIEHAALFEAAQRERGRAEEANRAKDEFLAMVSHELRTPLNAMLGWTRLLRGGVLSEEKRERALETIERNAKAQSQLIEDLLDVSRIISGKVRLDVRSADLGEIARSALDAVRPLAEAKAISLSAVLEPEAGPLVGDPDRLLQVVSNLLTNAIKFTPREGRVQVLMRRDNDSVELAVSDTGQGITPEFLPYVFDRFRQAKEGERSGGLGLGLAIVRHLVELHGGEVRAESEGSGRGSVFVIRLPSPEARITPLMAERPASSSESLAQTPALDGVSVLVVDDEPDVRELLASVLEERGARVSSAAGAAAALEALRRERPDVLISDIAMPGEDGHALIRAVRALPAGEGGRTPALALTAVARAEDRKKALVAGFTIHATKPVEPAELVILVAHLAGRIAGGLSPAAGARRPRPRVIGADGRVH